MKTETTFNTRQLLIAYRYFLPGVISLVICIVLIIVSFVSLGMIFETQSQLKRERRSLADVNQRINRLEFLSQGEIVQMQTAVNQALPTEKPVFEALVALRGIARDSNVVITDLSSTPGSLATESGRIQNNNKANKKQEAVEFEELGVTLEVEGTFDDLKSFFGGLISLKPLIDLDALRVSSKASDNQDGQERFTGEVDLIVYWMREFEFKKNNQSIPDLTESQQQVFEQISKYRSLDTLGQQSN